MSVSEKARRAGMAMARMRGGDEPISAAEDAAETPAHEAAEAQPTRVPLDGPLPDTMPVAQFLQHNPSLEDREALSPGVTGQQGYKNLVTGDDGLVHVKLTGAPKAVTPGTAQAVVQAREAASRALVDPLAPPKQPVAPLGDAIRQYGPAVVGSMYPGIFEPGGYKRYQQQYGMSESGELLVPAYTAPDTSAQQTGQAAQPAPSSSTDGSTS